MLPRRLARLERNELFARGVVLGLQGLEAGLENVCHGAQRGELHLSVFPSLGQGGLFAALALSTGPELATQASVVPVQALDQGLEV